MWRDDRIQAVIDTTTGFIAAKLAERLNRPIHEMERLFLASKTYSLLCDPETGLYADNVLVTADLFLREAATSIFTPHELTDHSFFKYRSLSDPYLKNTEVIFERRELWYSAPRDFNDPFDCNFLLTSGGLSDEEIENGCVRMARKRGRRLSADEIKRMTDTVKSGRIDQLYVKWQKEYYVESSVCCFSHLGDSIQMFSYYADGHKGLCIEFAFSVLDMPTGISPAQQIFGCGRIVPLDVVYQEAFPELDFMRLSGLGPNAHAQSLFGIKAKNWEHEKEYRIFRHQLSAGPVPFAPEILKRVILGAKTGDQEMATVKGWLKEWPTPVILAKAEADTNSFTLNIRDVETAGKHECKARH